MLRSQYYLQKHATKNKKNLQLFQLQESEIIHCSKSRERETTRYNSWHATVLDSLCYCIELPTFYLNTKNKVCDYMSVSLLRKFKGMNKFRVHLHWAIWASWNHIHDYKYIFYCLDEIILTSFKSIIYLIKLSIR